MSPLASEDDAAFQRALQAEDELGLVVRAHIYVEAQLIEFLTASVVSARHIEKLNLDYGERVVLAVALGLPKEYEKPLVVLGTTRNAFAHRLDTTLSKDRVDGFYKSFSADDKVFIQESHEATRHRPRLEGKLPSFGHVSQRQKFILMIITLRAFLKNAVTEVRASTGT